MACDIHQRVLKLRDVALGSRKSVQVNSPLSAASYDCAMDSLLALHNECSQASSLSKDKNIGRFLGKCKRHFAVLVDKLRSSVLNVHKLFAYLTDHAPHMFDCVDSSVVNAIRELRLTADDFEKISVIGKGHFGEVRSMYITKCVSVWAA